MKNLIKKLWQDESAQGATEYILILVAIVAIAVIFGDEFKSAVQGKLDQLTGGISGFNP